MAVRTTLDKAISAIDETLTKSLIDKFGKEIYKKVKEAVDKAKWIDEVESNKISEKYYSELKSKVREAAPYSKDFAGQLFDEYMAKWSEKYYRYAMSKYNSFVKQINEEVERLRKIGYKVTSSGYIRTFSKGDVSISGNLHDKKFFERMKNLK